MESFGHEKVRLRARTIEGEDVRGRGQHGIGMPLARTDGDEDGHGPGRALAGVDRVCETVSTSGSAMGGSAVSSFSGRARDGIRSVPRGSA